MTGNGLFFSITVTLAAGRASWPGPTAAMAVPAMMATGVANPKAQGQAITIRHGMNQ